MGLMSRAVDKIRNLSLFYQVYYYHNLLAVASILSCNDLCLLVLSNEQSSIRKLWEATELQT
jgi:hypothetical protein